MKQRRKLHRWTDEQVDFLRKHALGKTRTELMDMVNEKFNINITLGSIRSIMHRHQIKNRMQGHNTRFKDGSEPWNKGMKGLNLGGEAGWFKKGDKHWNEKPIGTMSTTNRSGIDWKIVKVAQPNEWKLYHHHLWEKEHGEIPEDSYVVFKNGDYGDVRIDNLMLVKKRAVLSVGKRGIRHDQPEINEAIHRLAELDLSIRDTEKEV